MLEVFLLTHHIQIRIVKDTVSEKGSKKPHRGYAFIVYEREKDMKGTKAGYTDPSTLCSAILDTQIP